jgi:hypothetical protein
MATRTPQRGYGGEAADTSRKERRHGKSELSPRLKGALKGAGKMAAEEILMTMVPGARIPRLMMLIAELGPGVKRSEVASALKKEGFDKLASTAPSASELKRIGKNAEARAKTAKATQKAERSVESDKRILRRAKADAAKEQTLQRSTPKKQVAAQRVKEERSDYLASKYGEMPPRTKAAQKEDAEKLAAIRFRRDKSGSVRKDSPWGKVSESHQKELVGSLKTAKQARATERKVNKLADLSDTIAKNAAKRKKAGKGAATAGKVKAEAKAKRAEWLPGKYPERAAAEKAMERKKAVRKAAEAKVTRLDSPPFDIKGLKGYSGYTMGAGAKKLDAIPGLEYIDPRDSFPLARDTLAFLKSHKGTADYRLVKQNGKTKAMAVEVEGIHTGGPKTGRKIVHIFDIGEKNAKWFLGY